MLRFYFFDLCKNLCSLTDTIVFSSHWGSPIARCYRTGSPARLNQTRDKLFSPYKHFVDGETFFHAGSPPTPSRHFPEVSGLMRVAGFGFVSQDGYGERCSLVVFGVWGVLSECGIRQGVPCLYDYGAFALSIIHFQFLFVRGRP